MAFRLLPPLSQPYRARRLMALTLRDVRRIARGRACPDWQGRIHGRLAALPEAATALQRGQLVAALCVGQEIIQLRAGSHRLGFFADLEPALAAVSQGKSAVAVAH